MTGTFIDHLHGTHPRELLSGCNMVDIQCRLIAIHDAAAKVVRSDYATQSRCATDVASFQVCGLRVIQAGCNAAASQKRLANRPIRCHRNEQANLTTEPNDTRFNSKSISPGAVMAS